MTVADLPHVNAVINSCVACLLMAGLILVKQRRLTAHKNVMVAALALSTAFLASYLVYHFNHGSTPFPGQGPIRAVYFTILISHTVLATVSLPFIIMAVVRAWRGQIERHRKIAKITWAMWFYVAVTGPVVYLMLYQLYPPAAG